MPSDHLSDSEIMGLVDQRKLLTRRAWWRKGEAIVSLAVLFACGFGTGYIYASRTITTTSATNAAAKVEAAADKVEAAADKVERAAAPKGNGK